MKYLLILGIGLLLTSCSTDTTPTAQEVINRSIQAHGLHALDEKNLSFDFRDKSYSLEQTEEGYVYTRSFTDSLGLIKDVLLNSQDFKRYIDDQLVELEKEWSDKYANSVNSVLYFVQLPKPLNDPAVIKSYQGEVEIKGTSYHQVQVRFEEDGGGKDFEDVFLYWFAKETYTMDYLAYSYITDGGGARFREAINRRTVDGVVFQDYINYRPEDKQTPLSELVALFEEGKLRELSRIKNVNVRLR